MCLKEFKSEKMRVYQKRSRGKRGENMTQGMNKQVLALLGLGHLMVDLNTGALPALLPGIGSVSGVFATVAVFVNVIGVGGAVTMSEIVAVPPLAIAPRLQTTVVVPLQLPWDAVAETNVVPVGITSVTTTLLASWGPLFVTVIVYSTF